MHASTKSALSGKHSSNTVSNSALSSTGSSSLYPSAESSLSGKQSSATGPSSARSSVGSSSLYPSAESSLSRQLSSKTAEPLSRVSSAPISSSQVSSISLTGMLPSSYSGSLLLGSRSSSLHYNSEASLSSGEAVSTQPSSSNENLTSQHSYSSSAIASVSLMASNSDSYTTSLLQSISPTSQNAGSSTVSPVSQTSSVQSLSYGSNAPIGMSASLLGMSSSSEQPLSGLSSSKESSVVNLATFTGLGTSSFSSPSKSFSSTLGSSVVSEPSSSLVSNVLSPLLTSQTSGVVSISQTSAVASSISIAPSRSRGLLSTLTSSAGTAQQTSTNDNWVPTQLIYQLKSQTEDSSTGSTSVSALGTPSAATVTNLPNAIAPANIAKPAKGYEAISIGFKKSLGYKFIVMNSLASNQIYKYLPNVLSYPFDDEGHDKFNDVNVAKIVPYSYANSNYMIAVAEVYFPSKYVGDLEKYLRNSSSELYGNPDPTSLELSSLIDANFPLTGVFSKGSKVNTNNQESSNGGSASNSYGSMDSNGGEHKSLSAGKISGVAVGASVGTLAYLGLMAYLFRRYRKNKSVRLASDSESNLADHPSQEFGNNSSGSNHDDRNQPVGRNVQISNPVNASNSLGWSP